MKIKIEIPEEVYKAITGKERVIMGVRAKQMLLALLVEAIEKGEKVDE